MTSIVSISSAELAQRRQKLRRQRQLKWLRSSWQTLAVSSLAGGLVWVTTLPAWVIRNREQVMIKGNHFLSEQTVRSLLPIAYPQSLFKVQPQEITNTLKTKAPIAEVTVDRQLFPPSLVVQIKERHPVAISLPRAMTPRLSMARDLKGQPDLAGAGLLDENGGWISLESYTGLDPSLALPTLRIIGRPEQYHPYWTKLYQAVSRSPVKVLEINWQDPANLILKTDLGTVYFGLYSSRFVEQLEALDRMRQLPTKINFNQITYIDLRNPDAPLVQLSKTQTSVKSQKPRN